MNRYIIVVFVIYYNSVQQIFNSAKRTKLHINNHIVIASKASSVQSKFLSISVFISQTCDTKLKAR